MLFRKKKKEMKKVFELEFEGKKFVVEAGEIAKQADGAVLVRLNETVVLSTACCSDEPKEGDFFPLTVGYEEKQIFKKCGLEYNLPFFASCFHIYE